MRSSSPVRSSPGDTTLFISTAASFLSDGPTLPSLNTTSTREGPRDASGESRAEEKRKTNAGAADASALASGVAKVDLGPLYEPWTLLPPEILNMVEKRLSHSHVWDEKCVPVVFTRNQNVSSGINRLKAILGFERNVTSTQDPNDKLRKEDVLIAVSAQGEGTTKLVGIVEMAKRLVAPTNDQGPAEMWFMYTSLASRTVPKRLASHKEGSRASQGGEDFEPAENGHDTIVEYMKVPILTVWMSKKSNPEFKSAFGEQTFAVGNKSAD